MKCFYTICCLSAIVGLMSCSQTNIESSGNIKIQPIPSPAGDRSGEPFLYSDDGVVYLSWVARGDSSSALMMSRLTGLEWSAPTKVAEGKTWFVNWADYPMLAAKGKNMVAHFLDRSGEGKYAYDVNLTFSENGGTSWQRPQILHDDKKQAEHGFVTLLPYGDNFFVTWLDGRNTVMEGTEGGDHHGGHHGAMSLRAAILDHSGKKINEWELDNKTCDCCQTTAAITPIGPVVVYRDRLDDEIRDMSIVRLVNERWTAPTAIHNDNWKIEGCPVNGPRVASKGNSLVVAWYTAAGDTARVNVVFSDNAGESFGSPIVISDGNTIGRVDIDILDEKSAVVTWMEGGEIKLVEVNKDGTKSKPITLATSSDSRSSGFPQLTLAGDRAIIAWTDDGDKMVKTAFLSINN